MQEQAGRFLDALYGDVPEGLWFMLWTLPQKESVWFTDAVAATSWVGEHGTGRDVYCSVGLSAEDRGAHRRLEYVNVPSRVVAGLVGLCADLDFRTPEKPLHPPDEGCCRSVARATGLDPTCLVHSGGGLQAWWLFNEAWVFESDAEAERAFALARAWQTTLTELAARKGWQVDSVHDPTRVMRVPGTFNRKRNKSDPDPVVILDMDEARCYEEDALLDACLPLTTAAPGGRAGPRTSPGGGREEWPAIDLSVPFPMAQHEALLENSDLYKRTWNHARKDLGADASAHDMALANVLVQAGFDPSQTAVVLREHQRKWGDKPEKVERADYYARTIHRAMRDADAGDAQEAVADAVEDATQPPEDRLAAVSKRLGVPIDRVERVTGDPAMYRLWIGGRMAELNPSDLTQQRRFGDKLISAVGVCHVPVGAKERPCWLEYVRIILSVAVELDVGDEVTPDGSTADLISTFLLSRTPVELTVGQMPDDDGQPFARDGKVWFRLTDLWRYARTAGYDVPTKAVLTQRVRALGGERTTINVRRTDGRTTSRSVWGVEERET